AKVLHWTPKSAEKRRIASPRARSWVSCSRGSFPREERTGTVMQHPLVRSSVAIGLLIGAAHCAAADEADSQSACEELAALGEPGNQRFRVDTAEWQATSDAPGPAAAPAHCLLRVTLDPRPSSIDGVAL